MSYRLRNGLYINETTRAVLVEIAGASASVAPGEAHIGEVGMADVVSVDTWTRPNDSTPYTIGDVISADVNPTGTTVLRALGASTATPLCRANGRGALLRYLSVKFSKTDFLPQIRVHLYGVAAPATALVGDNVAFIQYAANIPKRIGHIDLPVQGLYHAADDYTLASRDDDLDRKVKAEAADVNIYYRLEIIGGTSITPSALMSVSVIAGALQL